MNHGTIFYVDDNPKSRRLLTSVMRSCGFEVASTGDPIEALSQIRKNSFDLALLDYQMPHLTGSQLAQHIKRTKPDVPVVLISGFSALPPFELIFVDAHVGRGATLDELLDTMRGLIDSRYAPHEGVRGYLCNTRTQRAFETSSGNLLSCGMPEDSAHRIQKGQDRG
jgi:CheY-like chemotaxis protein